MKQAVKKECKNCGDSHEFYHLQAYWECKCGKVGYDSGGGFYSRTIGDPNMLITTVLQAPVPVIGTAKLSDSQLIAYLVQCENPTNN